MTLCAQPRETEWLEFKLNNFEPDACGRYISGLANAAILNGERHAYLVFGVADRTHEIVGTSLRLKNEKAAGAEPFEPWVVRMLDPSLQLNFVSFDHDGNHIEIIVIDPAYERPVAFKNIRYVRVDTQLRNLRDYPGLERTLWNLTSRFAFEQGIAATHLTAAELFKEFDCDALLKAIGVKAASPKSRIEALMLKGLIISDREGGYDVTNLLALAAAKKLKTFPAVALKSPRVIRYKGKSRLNADTDQTGGRGFLMSFEPLLNYIMDRVPHQEEMRHGTRQTIYSFPPVAVREFVANALIHQDFTSSGDRPLIEIFDDKMQITNPGASLVPTQRFIDAPAKSRNEKFADLMRLAGLCERRGSGIDRALDAIEEEALPPPLFQTVEQSTVVTMFAERDFADMTKEERIRACYQHASLRYEASNPMSNGSLRIRLGLKQSQYPQITNVINDAIDAGLVKPLNEDQANRNARYVPFYA